MADGKPQRTVRIDKDSLEFQFGKLTQKIDGINQKMDAHNGKQEALAKTISELTEVVRSRPCEVHEERIEVIELKLQESSEARQWDCRSKITFRQKLICVLIGAGITGAAAALALLSPF